MNKIAVGQRLGNKTVFKAFHDIWLTKETHLLASDDPLNTTASKKKNLHTNFSLEFIKQTDVG